jgi:thioesterase domain-containing protein
VELRNRLSKATGLRLQPTLALDHPTPTAVADHLLKQIGDPEAASDGAVTGAGAPAPGGMISEIVKQAHEQDTMSEVMPVLFDVARLRPSFGSFAELGQPQYATPISTAGATPRLICLPSFLAGSGPHQFARLAKGFDGRRQMAALSLPGFRNGDLLPGTWDAAIDALAESVRTVARGEPFVLVGYSIAGTLAHALAERFASEGAPLEGLVMVDTYAPEGDEMRNVFMSVLGEVIALNHESIAIDDTNVIAMAAYMRVLLEWTPAPIDVPGLLIRASEPIGDAFEAGRLPWWQLPETIVEVSGAHFELIEGSATATAEAIERWLVDTVGEVS